MPSPRLLALPAVVLGAGLIPAAVLAAPSTHPRAAAGVTAAGVRVAGLTERQAIRAIKAAGSDAIQGKVVFGAAGRDFTLSTADAGYAVNATKTAAAALNAPAGTAVPATTTHSHAATTSFAAGIAKAISRPARDATLTIGLQHQLYRRSLTGIGLDVAAAARQIDMALDTPGATRHLSQKVTIVEPSVTVDELRASHPAIVTVDKATFTLRLFLHLKYDRSYKVAVGQPAYPTPSGLFSIQDKQVNPTWSVPNSPWAGELQGTTVEGGSAANPLKARWMGIVDGVGIHGTGEDYSIGSAASHGCIRMHVADVISLYPSVPVGSKVLIR